MEHSIVGRINAGRHKFFIAVTGGGTSFIGDYISQGGASKVLIGAHVPYAQSAFDKFIRGKVERYASEEGARKLALASFRECLDAGVPVSDALGVGASCSIASTSPEREGRKHKFYVASHSYNGTHVAELILNQGRTRVQEEHMTVNLIYNILVSATLKEIPPYGMAIDQMAGESFRMKGWTAPEPIAAFYNGAAWFDYINNCKLDDDTLAIYPGSWNPIHEAHLSIKATAEQILGVPVIFEFTINNTDKARIDYIEFNNRLKQLEPYPHILTRASYFRSKVALFKEAWPEKKLVFVVGEDTWSRIWNEAYCEDNSLSKEAAFFARHDVKFLVFARGGEPFKLYDNVKYGEPFRIKDPRAENFNMNISSSQIRKQQQTT